MAEPICATDLMMRDFVTLGINQSLRDATRLLLDRSADAAVSHAVVAVSVDRRYAGILTPRLLRRSLLGLWMPAKNVRQSRERLQDELIEVVEDRLKLKLGDALPRGLPTAAPGDRLFTLMELIEESRLECIAVVEDGNPLGLVTVTDVVNAAASLALTPDHQGIHIKGKRFT